MRDLIARGAMKGPRMTVSSQGVSRRDAPGGSDPAAMRTAVEARIAGGADWIKVFASRGSYDSVGTSRR